MQIGNYFSEYIIIVEKRGETRSSGKRHLFSVSMSYLSHISKSNFEIAKAISGQNRKFFTSSKRLVQDSN